MQNGFRSGGLKPPSRKDQIMKTKEMLEKMPNKQREYLENLQENIKRAKTVRQYDLADEFKAVAKRYIKALADCGVVDDFKTVWCWFTL